MINYVRHVRAQLRGSDEMELNRVDALARRLRTSLEERAERIVEAHVHGASSSAIQRLVSEVLLTEMGFDEEVVLTPQDGLVTRARPDFYFDLGEHRGILAEVERGGTTTNNHDLKDLWKAHVAANAQHLFLMVPNSNWKPDGSSREKPFPIVARRLGSVC